MLPGNMRPPTSCKLPPARVMVVPLVPSAVEAVARNAVTFTWAAAKELLPLSTRIPPAPSFVKLAPLMLPLKVLVPPLKLHGSKALAMMMFAEIFNVPADLVIPVLMVSVFAPVALMAVAPPPVLLSVPSVALTSRTGVEAVVKVTLAPAVGGPSGFQFPGVLQLLFPPAPVH